MAEVLLGMVLPNAVVTALRAEPVIESEVPSRLNGVTPGIPLPLDPEAVRPLWVGVVNTGMFDVEGVQIGRAHV